MGIDNVCNDFASLYISLVFESIRLLCMEAQKWSVVYPVPVQGFGQQAPRKFIPNTCLGAGQRLCGQELPVRESK